MTIRVAAIGVSHPFAARAKQLLAEGRFGPRPTSARYPAWDAGWMLDPSVSGGGCLRNLGNHGLDLFLFLTGEEAAVRRSASGVLGTLEIGNTFPRDGTDGERKIAGRDAILIQTDEMIRFETTAGTETSPGEPLEPLALSALRDALEHWRRGAPPPISVHDCARVVA